MEPMTFEEFSQAPLTYTAGMVGDWGARRMYRNSELGIQKEVHTKRRVAGDIYSGWREGKVHLFMDNDEREFANTAELYEAWMTRHFGDGHAP